jgi:hypothetical protein
MAAGACNTSSSGSVRARESGITTVSQCKTFCETCSQCQFISFSIGAHPGNKEDHDDCSWYSSCDLDKLQHVGANYISTAVHKSSPPNPPSEPVSGVRRYHPSQELPSPRYANCIVDGKQAVRAADNAVTTPSGEDDEWFAVEKEQQLAERCMVPPPAASGPTTTPSYFWTVMSQNGNAPSHMGSDTECLPYCYLTPPGAHLLPPGYNGSAGYPPAVNASSSRCVHNIGATAANPAPTTRNLITSLGARSAFSGLPQNQGKVMVHYTDPTDPKLFGSFNWTFELGVQVLSFFDGNLHSRSDVGIYFTKVLGLKPSIRVIQ